MEFSFDDGRPIWPQLAEQITERILLRVYPPGTRLPSVRDLAMEAGVNPNTMQRALASLETDGLVTTNRTSGRIVTQDEETLEKMRRQYARAHIERYFNAMAKIGYTRENAIKLIVESEEC